MKTAPVTLLLVTALLFASSASAADPTHVAITTARDFFSAVGKGDFERAGKLVVPERYPKEKLQKLKENLVVEEAKFGEAFVGQDQVAVITKEISPRVEGHGRTGRWGVALRKHGELWLIRDMDFLPNEEALEKYLAGFRKVEPGAQKVTISN